MSGSSLPTPIRLATQDDRLVVEFRWQDDRFVHRVWTPGDDVLSSVDGQADEVWPPSPPLQQLSPESIGEKQLIFGVGSAGQSHWSVSIGVVDQDGQPALKFDWACRCKQAPEWLGSTYIASAGFRIEPSPSTTLRASGGDQQHLEPSHLGGGPGTHQWTYTIAAAR